jgi:hypothetical protein
MLISPAAKPGWQRSLDDALPLGGAHCERKSGREGCPDECSTTQWKAGNQTIEIGIVDKHGANSEGWARIEAYPKDPWRQKLPLWLRSSANPEPPSTASTPFRRMNQLLPSGMRVAREGAPKTSPCGKSAEMHDLRTKGLRQGEHACH